MKTNAKTTAIYTAIAGCVVTIANALGYSVTGTNTGKAATVAFITAGIATVVHLVTTHPVAKKVVKAPVVLAKKIVTRTVSPPLVMFDTITPSEIPSNAQAVAGYVDGKWQTWNELVRMFPKTHKVAITVFGAQYLAGAEHPCIDCERGDATPVQTASWIEEQINAGRHPVAYASTSTMVKVLGLLRLVPRHKFTVWTAHYGKGEHICDSKCFMEFGGDSAMYADGTQWTDVALGRNLDQSKLSPTFFAT